MHARIVPSVVLLTLACHATPEPSATPAPRTNEPAREYCYRTVSGASVSGWREVQGEGFSFCVPAHWRGAGRRWSSGSSGIEWARGIKPLGSPARTARQRDIPTGLGPPPPSVASARELAGLPYGEVIDGQIAMLSRKRTDVAFSTSAEWNSARLHFIGHAPTDRAADEQLVIYKTVRFR